MNRVLLTGGSSGIGEALARSLTEHRVWAVGRRARVPETPENIRYSRCDLTDWAAVQALARDVGEGWGGLDAVVHCAGVQGPIGPAMETDPGAWVEAFRVNVEPAFLVLRACYPWLRGLPGKHAKVVLFSGGGASKARPNFSAYAAAKTAIVRLTETLAHEWVAEPIDLNVVAPGAINTAMTSAILQAGAERAGREYAQVQAQLARGGDSLEPLLRLVRFLLSPASDGLTGRFLSAQWDEPASLAALLPDRAGRSDVYTLRRIIPEDRGALP